VRGEVQHVAREASLCVELFGHDCNSYRIQRSISYLVGTQVLAVKPKSQLLLPLSILLHLKSSGVCEASCSRAKTPAMPPPEILHSSAGMVVENIFNQSVTIRSAELTRFSSRYCSAS